MDFQLRFGAYGIYNKMAVSVRGRDMITNKKVATNFWVEQFGDASWVQDFHGNWMYKDDYGNETIKRQSPNKKKVYCGWVIHFILPIESNGSKRKDNWLCTSIETDNEAEDRPNFTIEKVQYSVRNQKGTSGHTIYFKDGNTWQEIKNYIIHPATLPAKNIQSEFEKTKNQLKEAKKRIAQLERKIKHIQEICKE